MRTGRKLLFALIAVAVVAAGSEIGVRLAFPRLTDLAETMQFSNPHRDQPESFVRDAQLFWRLRAPNPAWEVNADGYRGPRRAVAKPAGVLRICCLGDSCTFGLGNPAISYEQTYAAVLEKLLRERTGREVEVLNFGCPGYTSWQGRKLLETKVVGYQPDVVTAYFGINDGFEAVGYPDARQKLAGRVGGVQSLLHRSAAYLLLTRGITEARRAGGSAGLLRVSTQEFGQNAAAMLELGRRHGFEMLFLPAQFITDRGTLDVEQGSRVEPSVPVDQAFAASGHEPTELIFAPPDAVHPTPLGHRLIAQALAEALAGRVQGGEKK